MYLHLSLTFTQETDDPPDEVAAAVAEGGFGQGDFLEAVTRCRALVLGPEPGGLLRPLLHGLRTRSPAVRGVRVRRSAPAGVGHVLPHKLNEKRATTRGMTGFTSDAQRRISRKCSSSGCATSHRVGHSGAARSQGAVLGVAPGAVPASDANYPDPNTRSRRPGHDFAIKPRLVMC